MKPIPSLAFVFTGVFALGPAMAQVEKAALVAADGAPFDRFGRAVAVGGGYAAVGAPNHGLPVSQCGAVYNYKQVAGSWVFDAKLQAPVPMVDDLFGFALSTDGERLAVGICHDDQVAADAGAVIVYRRDPAGWVFEAKLLPGIPQAQQVFGCSVSLSGSRLAIGALGLGVGATYVLVRSGTTWSQEAVVLAPTGLGVGRFGEHISLSGDRVAIGARSTNIPFTHTGAAFTYTRSGAAWNPEASFPSPNAQPSGEFGGSLALGGSLLIGASNENSAASGGGRVYSYTFGTSWTLGQTLVPATIADNDRFGWSIAMTRGYAVIGCLFRDITGVDSGSAFVYQSSSGVWLADQRVRRFHDRRVGHPRLRDRSIGDRHLIVGAESAGVLQGAAYIFQR